MFAVTIHLSVPELVIVITVLTMSALRELMHILRANGDEFLSFLSWWVSFRRELTEIRRR